MCVSTIRCGKLVSIYTDFTGAERWMDAWRVCLIIKLRTSWAYWTLESMWPATNADTIRFFVCVGGYLGGSERPRARRSVIVPQLAVTSEEPVFSGMFAPLPLSLSIHSTLKGHLLCGLMALQSTKLLSNPAVSTPLLCFVVCSRISVCRMQICFCSTWSGQVETTQSIWRMYTVRMAAASLIWMCVFP